MKNIMCFISLICLVGCTTNAKNEIQVINDSKKEIAILNAQNVIEAGTYYYNSKYINNLGVFNEILFMCDGFSCSSNYDKLNISNDVPNSGSVTILENGKVIIKDLVFYNYTCNEINNKIACEK